MSQTIGVLRFPGTNCDRDVYSAIEAKGYKAQWLWHQDRFEANGMHALVLPGGFSYGDYLRAGALAARSPAMHSVRESAAKGVPVLGICNGFQILCEAGLLPGVLVRNRGRRFIDDWVELKLENGNAKFANTMGRGSRARLPIAHADGCFHIEADEYKALRDRGQVWWTYCENPNGAAHDIAGVMNQAKNVAALMPHPERAMTEWMGGTDGARFFEF